MSSRLSTGRAWYRFEGFGERAHHVGESPLSHPRERPGVPVWSAVAMPPLTNCAAAVLTGLLLIGGLTVLLGAVLHGVDTGNPSAR